MKIQVLNEGFWNWNRGPAKKGVNWSRNGDPWVNEDDRMKAAKLGKHPSAKLAQECFGDSLDTWVWSFEKREDAYSCFDRPDYVKSFTSNSLYYEEDGVIAWIIPSYNSFIPGEKFDLSIIHWTVTTLFMRGKKDKMRKSATHKTYKEALSHFGAIVYDMRQEDMNYYEIYGYNGLGGDPTRFAPTK